MDAQPQPRRALAIRPPPDACAEAVGVITRQLLAAMGVPAEVICRDRRGDESPHVWVEVLTPESRLLIGDHGSALVAFEHILRRLVRAQVSEPVRVIADINSYRVRRIELIRRLARGALQRVRRTGRAVVLEPMRPSDRRIVHVTLTEEEGVTTESLGEEPMRRVVVRPKDPLA